MPWWRTRCEEFAQLVITRALVESSEDPQVAERRVADLEALTDAAASALRDWTDALEAYPASRRYAVAALEHWASSPTAAPAVVALLLLRISEAYTAEFAATDPELQDIAQAMEDEAARYGITEDFDTLFEPEWTETYRHLSQHWSAQADQLVYDVVAATSRSMAQLLDDPDLEVAAMRGRDVLLGTASVVESVDDLDRVVGELLSDASGRSPLVEDAMRAHQEAKIGLWHPDHPGNPDRLPNGVTGP